ncbi:hypothetical protein VitviT2T_029915 [Vitis vinifera]|uniref:Lipid-binding serum glycoprotein C-terminal domain-containing protein n=2 Tax=Vitis vinifera TaxID=29760 RepID=A0ABY9E0N5_VITVI|nr:putative BPI/LBP family protein At1g04970 [Vitis vinifera]WKA12540.1 hypothetical protein VitviT2T_029915 [Vitis vinifera]|eukprot:XP_002277143.2 PREDICTED: putative BPI/LBP family protein At1g04970 [Vitis vinifera]
MGLSSNLMAPAAFFIVLALFSVPTDAQIKSDEGFISVFISSKGLGFVKDLLMHKAVSSLTPIEIQPIEKIVKIPLVGQVDILLSNITILSVGVGTSYVSSGGAGVVIVASGGTANMSMNWKYSYDTWLFPISDKGAASVLVEGMAMELTLGLKDQNGTLSLSLLDWGCFVKDIFVKLDGGATWFYQGLVDAFKEQIASAVEDSVSKRIREGIIKLDSLLQSVPKEIPVDHVAALNVTFVKDPVSSNSSIDFEINGLFTAKDGIPAPTNYHKKHRAPVSCTGPAKMIEMSLDENVFNSATSVYFKADFMSWIVNKMPDQSLLNTAGWKYIVPQLYNQYPDDGVNLNISVSSQPMLKIADDKVDTTIYSDMIIDVLDSGEVIQVACISLVINATGSIQISKNNLTGSFGLTEFTMSLKWSNIGDLDMHQVQAAMSTVIDTVFLPYLNLHLAKGFPLPVLPGFTLENAEIICRNSQVMVCSDVVHTGEYDLYKLLPLWVNMLSI